MANIKNFGLSGVSADVQFGKAGGRVVYDSGNSVFKVTQADGSTLDNIRVATTPLNNNDAASKAYVDSKSSSDSAAVQAELDATQTGAGLSAAGAYVAPTTSNYHNAATSLANADFLIDAAVKAGLDAAATDRANIRSEFATADTGLANDLTAKIGDATVDGSAGNTITDRIASSLSSAQSYADTAESDAKTYADGIVGTEATARANADSALQSELDATQTGAGLAANGAYVAPTTSNYHDAATSLANADFLIDAALKAEETARIAADNALGGRLDIIEGDATTAGSIAKALADAQAYTDNAVAGENELAEMNDVALGTLAAGDLLAYNGTAWVDFNLTVNNVSGDGSLAYDAATGVFSYTGPSATETRAHFSAANTGTGYGDLSYAAGVFTFDRVTDAEIRGAVSAGGDLAYNSATGVFSFTERTDAEVRGLISVTDAGGDGSLSYNASTGVITYTGPSASEVRAHFSAGGDLAYNSATGQFSVTKFTAAEAITAVEGEATLDLTGALTVAGATTLNQLTTVVSAVTLASANAEVNVFHVTDSAGAELFEVRQNGDAVIGGTLTVNGSGATISGGVTSTDATFTGDVNISGSLTVDGDATFNANIFGSTMTLTGDLVVAGNTTIGDADTDQIVFVADVNSNIIPDAAGWDLGAVGKVWDNVYANNVYADLTGDVTGQVSDISNHEATIEGYFSVVDNGGDGSLTYANGVFTYTGPSATETRAHFSGGTGVTITNGIVAIGQAVGTSDNVTFNSVTVNGTLNSDDITAANVTIAGNLTVTGTTTTVNTETIELADNIIVFNSNATGSATQDAGIEIERGDDTNVTLLWDENNDRWTVGGETFVAATFIGNLTGNVTGQVSDISNFTTNDLVEGTGEGAKLYYTDGRVAAYLVANSYATETYVDNAVADKDSFAIRAVVTNSGSIGTIVNVAGKTYYVSRIVVDVTTAFDAAVSVSDGTNTLMAAASIEEDVVGTYVAEMDFSTATAGGATISLVSAATAGAATVTVEYVQL